MHLDRCSSLTRGCKKIGSVWLFVQIVGVIFPVMIIALVPIRQYVMPHIFSRCTLHELDPAEYEEAPPMSQEEAARESADQVELVRDCTWPIAYRLSAAILCDE